MIDKIVGVGITTYHIQLHPGVKTFPSKACEEIIKVRIGGDTINRIGVPERNCFGFEVAFRDSETVEMGEIINSSEFKEFTDDFKFVIGKTPSGKIIFSSLVKAKNMLIAGMPESGKSVSLNILAMSLLQYSPKDLKLILIDPKETELTPYNDCPHLLSPVITTDTDQACRALSWVYGEVGRRNSVLRQIGEKTIGMAFKTIEEYNAEINRNAIAHKYLLPEAATKEIDYCVKAEKLYKQLKSQGLNDEADELKKQMDSLYKEREDFVRSNGIDVQEYRKIQKGYEDLKLPRLVVIIDEIGDLLMNSTEETIKQIVKIGQKGRACGVSLIMALQRPSANILDSRIKAIMQTKFAFRTSSASDSRMMLEQKGAENLNGKGDMFLLQENKPIMRVKGAFISSEQIGKALKHIKST